MDTEKFSPRASQKNILSFRHGKMGVSAVPGSGKTWTLSQLAAEIILSDILDDDQEILIVTLTNSAVDNFKSRINTTLENRGSPSLISRYHVCTLHSLANDILREHPNIVGLDSDFQILDENGSSDIIRQISSHFLNNNANFLETYFKNEENRNNLITINPNERIRLIEDIAKSYIRTAKDSSTHSDSLNIQLNNYNLVLPLAKVGNDLYVDYQRILFERGLVDFDDLIYLALEVLQQDTSFLTRLQYRWMYILEDEAQDSSHLQEMILRKLVGIHGNWVRVGDPNQAIYETFTTASPKYLIDFLREPEVRSQELPESGRSTSKIITLANNLICWTKDDHPNELVRDALTEPFIRQVPSDDPRPNPDNNLSFVYIYLNKLSPDEEVNSIIKSIKKWLPDHPNDTVAILAPNNNHAIKFVEELEKNRIEVIDGLLKNSNSTRAISERLGKIIDYLITPQHADKLVNAYYAIKQNINNDQEKAVVDFLRKCPFPEAFLFPRVENDWIEEKGLEGEHNDIYANIFEFRNLLQSWEGLVLLPIDQIILALSNELFTDPADLASAHHLAISMRRIFEMNPNWQILNIRNELNNIAMSKQKFSGYSQEVGFNPDLYKGKVVVATIHKSKGLEWDRVYLTSVNNYDFPSNLPEDIFQSEKWFIRDNLNLPAETMDQLKILLSQNEFDTWYHEGIATYNARQEYVRERLRLLYVGITRARKELIMTWNTGKRGIATPALALQTLYNSFSSF